jgi:hypothetical protein
VVTDRDSELSSSCKIALKICQKRPGRGQAYLPVTSTTLVAFIFARGADYRHWFRVKFSGRFRLFFRYSSQHKVIVYAWVNDENTLRKSGSIYITPGSPWEQAHVESFHDKLRDEPKAVIHNWPG